MKPKIKGGRAHFNGVSIYSTRGFAKVTLNKKTGMWNIKKGRFTKSQKPINKLLDRVSKIPFLRSLVLLINTFRRNKRIFFISMIVYLFFILGLIFLDDSIVEGATGLLEQEVLLYLSIMIVVAGFIKITPISRYHGAEHMVINYYKDTQDLDFTGLKNASRVSNHCGSLLVIETFILFMILNTAIPISDVALLFSYMIAYEIFKSQWVIAKPIMMISRGIQKYLLTSKPYFEELETAKLALKKSLFE